MTTGKPCSSTTFLSVPFQRSPLVIKKKNHHICLESKTYSQLPTNIKSAFTQNGCLYRTIIAWFQHPSLPPTPTLPFLRLLHHQRGRYLERGQMGDGRKRMFGKNGGRSRPTKSISKVYNHSILFLKGPFFLARHHHRSDRPATFEVIFSRARIIRMGSRIHHGHPHMKISSITVDYWSSASKCIADAFEIYRSCWIGRASGKLLLVEGLRQVSVDKDGGKFTFSYGRAFQTLLLWGWTKWAAR